jgi:hypothetical protein
MSHNVKIDDKSDYCFALTGKSWALLYKHNPDLLQKVGQGRMRLLVTVVKLSTLTVAERVIWLCRL